VGHGFTLPDGTRIAAPALTYVRTTTLHAIHSKALLARQIEHVSAVVKGIAEQLDRRQRSFLEGAWRYSEIYQQWDATQTRFLSKPLGEVGPDLTEVELDFRLPPSKAPPLEFHGDGYAYRTFKLMCPASGLTLTHPDVDIKLKLTLGPLAAKPEP
jgi:hypothetical protein